MPPLVLGVDLRCLSADGSPGRGIEHASRELWSTLCEVSSVYSIVCVGFAPTGAIIDHEANIHRLIGSRGRHLRQAMKKYPVDALLIPSGAVPWGISVPCYPWVHDVAIFQHPEWFPQSWFQRQITTRLFVRGLKRARHIFVISQSSKQDVSALLPHLSDRMSVTGQGIVTRTVRTTAVKPRHPFALLLGSTEKRKNVSFIKNLWPQVKDRVMSKGIECVIAGLRGWDDPVDDETEGIRRITCVSDSERDQLMQQATIMIIPSLYEGFSRVALEGMNAGIPVLTSDRGALPEIVGQGGICLSLDHPHDWVEVIVEAFEGSARMEALKQRAQDHAQTFSWKKTAHIMLAKISSDG